MYLSSRYIPQGTAGPFDLAWKCTLAQMHFSEFMPRETKPSSLVQVTLDMQLPERYRHLTTYGSVRLGIWIIDKQFSSEIWMRLLVENNIKCVMDLPSWVHIISNASFKVMESNILNVAFLMTREDYERYKFSGTVFVYEDGTISSMSTCSEELKRARIEQVDFKQDSSSISLGDNNESGKVLILSELKETMDSYEAKVTFPNTLKGALQTEFKLANSLVVLNFSDRKSKQIEVRLSCAVNPDTSHFKIYRSKGVVECKFFKDRELTFGAGALPYAKITFMELPLFPRGRERICPLMGHMFRGNLALKVQHITSEEMRPNDPYLNMKESIQFFGIDYADDSKINVYAIVFADKNIDFLIYVKRFCSYKKHPIILVKVVDFYKRSKLLRAGFEEGKYPADDKILQAERIAFTRALAEERLRNIICSKEESLLFRRWLLVNSFRVTQDPVSSPVPMWIYHSFITLLFPYVPVMEDMKNMLKNMLKMGKLI